MGISIQDFKFLQIIASEAPLGDVLTFGRQNLNITQDDIERDLGTSLKLTDYTFSEDLLRKAWGATSVSSVDGADFEGATYVRDLNAPVHLDRQFDTIIDCGTAEHVFDVAQVFKNAINLCTVGGRIFHSLPSNSECGHGFYQFAPELFFSLYSEVNGFADTRVYIVDRMRTDYWYEVRAPKNGARAMANDMSATYVFCVTKKVRDVESLSVQQSDYVKAWEAGAAPRRGTRPVVDLARSWFKGSFMARPATMLYRGFLAPTGLNRRNPHLRRRAIRADVESSKTRPGGN